jgi:lysophospholipase L1-like esterase
MSAIRVAMALVIIAVSSCGPDEEPVTPPLPRRIAAIGDSITRATNVCCLPGDHPSRSWSVGVGANDGVQSHLERIVAADPEPPVRAFNLAVAGATVADTVDQAALAVRRRADYVTILIGANDVCGSPSSMTSVAVFRARMQATVETLEAGLPDARFFVASIPNVVRLWRLFRDDAAARLAWRTAGTCPAVLSTSSTSEDRRAVLERVRRFNRVLAETCAAYPRCRFDGGAVFRYAFTRNEVSELDRFHPSVDGQAALARITWTRSWWS